MEDQGAVVVPGVVMRDWEEEQEGEGEQEGEEEQEGGEEQKEAMGRQGEVEVFMKWMNGVIY